MLSNSIIKITGTSSVRRLNHSGTRVVPYGGWAVSIYKKDSMPIDWWRSAPEDIFFVTIPHKSALWCDIKKYEGGLPISRQIHKMQHQEGNKIRFQPYFGPGVRWNWMRADTDTLLEYFPETKILRVHYPTGLRPFQDEFYKGKSTITKILMNSTPDTKY